MAYFAILTGLEPATSAVTGRRANQLRYRTLLVFENPSLYSDPNGIRTRATAVKGRRPRPLNDGAYKAMELFSTERKAYCLRRGNATRAIAGVSLV